ncbi:alginate export family protein [Rhodomicrobium lacus]|uniref:alginate export family protein n=1 Tax=Rhodomicrobium lacus TaxID=2498452 RepID=UPI0026E29ABD|nr:alginate export family protein [Rhodomicrobium lacus]WKW51380.1 alginate export family protein [Rhodomicrobium lacus]
MVFATANVRADSPGGSKEEIEFKFYRWKEDYSWLAKTDEPLTGYEQLKYMPLFGSPENYISFGGEIRYRLDTFAPYLFDLNASQKDFASNQERILLHTDVHLSENFRAFLQVDASTEDGRVFTRAYDQSGLDLRQGFADFILPSADQGTLTIRLGRQELWLGPTRWLAVRDPTNIRRTFDGALVEYVNGGLTVRVFDAKPVIIDKGWFDDTTSEVETFKGVYAIAKKPLGAPFTVETYLMDREQQSVRYARGTAHEERWTLGSRVTGDIGPVKYAVEGAYQFGTFGSADISAFGFNSDISSGVGSLVGIPKDSEIKPRLGFRTHYGTGDRNLSDGTFRTFAAPYPAASEIAEMSLIGLSNAINVSPYIQFQLPHDIFIEVNWNWVWKDTIADSVYGPPGTILRAAGSTARGVADIAEVQLEWDVNTFVKVEAVYAHVFAGDYISAARGTDGASGSDFDYGRAQVMIRF